jgi:hypothetical protein
MEAVMKVGDDLGAKGLRRRLMKTSKRALTLIEGAMVLGLFAFVVGAAMYYYGQSNTARQVTNGLGELASIQQAIRTTYGGQASYNGLAATVIANSNSLPKKMVLANGLRSSFGTVAVAAAAINGSTDAGFTVTFNSLPKEVCTKMAVQDLGRGLFSISVNGAITATPPVTPANANTQCVANNAIAWTFNQ